jgi:SAM-dependent methyltransferase
MQPVEYSKLAEFEDTYWWHIGRGRIISKQLSRALEAQNSVNILNVGSGTGGTVPLLERFGSVLNVDVAESAVRACRARGIRNVLKVKGTHLPFQDESFDLVTALDVLEHIADDREAIAEWQRLLKPGGKLLITVPAYQWLWSEHDESLHHFRRYTAASLHRLLNREGFSILKRTYAICFSFPLIVGYRLLRSMLPWKRRCPSYVIVPRLVNSFLAGLLSIEAHLLRFLNIPIGTSVLMIAEKAPCAEAADEHPSVEAASDGLRCSCRCS